MPPSLGAERIQVLYAGQGGRHIESWLLAEPMIDYIWVPSRDMGYGLQTMNKLIRQYFPRSYEKLREYDFILLHSPEVYFFSSKQVEWMYDAIEDGAGAINTASVMSQIAQIHNAWANSVLSDAFPNDAPAVVERGQGGTSAIESFHLRVNRQFPDPVLTPFLPYGIEGIAAADSRLIILREGAQAIAYQVGNHPGNDVPFLAAWEFGKGRTLTTGDVCGASSFFSYPTWVGLSDYIPDIFLNLIFYGTRRGLIEDVQIYHHLRTNFLQIRTRLGVLISLLDFVEKFGASSASINAEINDLRDMIHDADERYLEGDFASAEEALSAVEARFTDVEALARRLKDTALAWVYAIEWLTMTSTLMISSVILWSLMVKRRLYRSVGATRLTTRPGEQN